MADGILRYCIMMAMLVISTAILAAIGLGTKAIADPSIDWLTARFGLTPVCVVVALIWLTGAYFVWVRPRRRQ